MKWDVPHGYLTLWGQLGGAHPITATSAVAVTTCRFTYLSGWDVIQGMDQRDWPGKQWKVALYAQRIFPITAT